MKFEQYSIKWEQSDFGLWQRLKMAFLSLIGPNHLIQAAFDLGLEAEGTLGQLRDAFAGSRELPPDVAAGVARIKSQHRANKPS